MVKSANLTQELLTAANSNKKTIIVGEKVILVPYLRRHVHRYHGWMQSEEIRQLTASEPLSLEAEYEMQQTWLNDPSKHTFILIDRERLESLVSSSGGAEEESKSSIPSSDNYASEDDKWGTQDMRVLFYSPQEKELLDVSMTAVQEDQRIIQQLASHALNTPSAAIGDVNVFLHDHLQDEDTPVDPDVVDPADDEMATKLGLVCVPLDNPVRYHQPDQHSEGCHQQQQDKEEEEEQQQGLRLRLRTGEMEIMVAEQTGRRKGVGREAVLMMMEHAAMHLGVSRFLAKVTADNGTLIIRSGDDYDMEVHFPVRVP